MGRATQQEKQESHQRIVAVASRLFRKQGVDATGVSEIMAAAGMTHGGFYRHFGSKNDLVCEAIQFAFCAITDAVEADIAANGSPAALGHYVDMYLSREHLDAPEDGCPIAALGAEIGRSGKVACDEMNAGISQLSDVLGRGLKGSHMATRTNARTLLAMLAGFVILARATPEQGKRAEVLMAGREAVKQFTQA